MTPILIQDYKSPVGELIVGSFNNQLVLCDWKYRKMRDSIDSRIKNALDAQYVEETCESNNIAVQQLQEYFSEKRSSFDLNIRLVGTDFQQNVWHELLKIPYGKTDTYLDLSKKINNVKAIRAVASANGANSLSIIVPCHRVIGSNQQLIGYAGGIAAKKKLLQLEKCEIFANQLDLFS